MDLPPAPNLPATPLRPSRPLNPAFPDAFLADDRIAVIDIGSNSVRLVVFDGAVRSPTYFFNEKIYCGLGTEIEATGKLSPEGRQSAMLALCRFASLLPALGVKRVEAVATAALREATDGAAFSAELEAASGLKINIISGEEEGRFAALGVLLGDDGARGMVVDIGGASMEIATVRDGEVGECVTTPLGPFRLSATEKTGEALDSYIAATLRETWPSDATDGPCYLVGGGWRAFASIAMGREDYPLHVLHGYEMSVDHARDVARWIAASHPADLVKAGLSKTRAANAPWTAHVLLQLIETRRPERFILSACGLREGVLFNMLPPAIRAGDPLTQSARVMECRAARFPGFGDELAGWLAPILPEVPERLLRAACLLSDVNWRIHPDYRALACFATATQSSLVGLSHHDRVLLAVALAYRYKGARSALSGQAPVALLDKQMLGKAEALGRLIRLGAMVTGTAVGLLHDLKLTRSATELVLNVPRGLKAMISPTVEARLRSAAQPLGLTPVIARRGE